MNISSINSSSASMVQRPSDRPKGGQIMQQLQSLAQSDPSKLKQVASNMAASLRADAQKAGGDAGQALTKIADKLDKVAQSGDLSALAPQQGAQGAGGAQGHKHHHGHHHGGGGGGASANGNSADGTNPSDPFSEVRSDLLQAFTTALDSLNQPAAPTATATASSV